MSGHHHHHHLAAAHRHLVRPLPRLRTRRAFLGDVGGGALALALLTPAAIAACSADDTADDDPASDGTTSTSTSTESTDDENPAADEAAEAGDQTDADADGGLRWARTNLGFVSAYVVARGNSAAIVDTGTDGSADAIGQSLADLGLNYNDVESVILTHKHGDHIGSITEVLTRAVNASAYAGEADLSAIDGDLLPLIGGEDVFGMEMLATPGHTAGHMAAIDHGAGILIAGDALTIGDGAAAEPPAQFTEDGDEARATIQALAQLTFNTLLVGHGDPIESAADQSVTDLAASF